ncbi:MAG: T9SS type A sorting domain-containing protein, partial [Spiribacter salinus]
MDMNGGMVNINGQADFGEQFSMSDGSISGGNSSELRIGSNSTLTFSPPCTSFKCIAGEGSLYSRGTVVLEGGAQGISLSAANAQVGGWSGMLLSGTAVTDPVLNNVTITQARNGLSLVNVDDLFVEGSLSISDSEFDGLRLINADLSWLSGIELNQNGRHGMWTDGAYVDYMSSIDLQYNTGAGLWAESGGWLEQGVNFAITDNTQNGIYTTGSVTLEITDSPIHGNSPRDANASGTSTQLITNNWWGQAPPAASQFYEAPFANQTYDPWQTSNTFPSSVAAREPDVRVGSQAKTRPLDAFRALHHSELSSAIAGLPRQQQAEGWITALDALLLEQSYTAVTELGQTLMAEAAEQAQPWGVAIGRRVLVARLMLGQHEAAAATLQWLDERRDGDAAPGHLYDLLTLMAPAGSGDAAPSGARPVAEGPQPATKTARVDFHNYPNPFNPSTMLSWELSEAGHVRVQVYDVNGRRVATLIDAPRQAGRHTARFDAANLASGMYFARMEL